MPNQGGQGTPGRPPTALAALLTDFGTDDVYVGVMKAVLLGTMAAPFLVLPALGQQEVDPTNYPLPEATKTVAHPTKEAMTAMKRKQRVASIHRSRRESNGQTRHASSLAQNREPMLASK